MRSYRLYGGRSSGRNLSIRKREERRMVLGKFEVSRRVQAEKELGIESGTCRIKLSHWAYWRRFHGVWEVETVTLGALAASTEVAMGLRMIKELDLFAAFAAFIVLDTRYRDMI